MIPRYCAGCDRTIGDPLTYPREGTLGHADDCQGQVKPAPLATAAEVAALQRSLEETDGLLNDLAERVLALEAARKGKK